MARGSENQHQAPSSVAAENASAGEGITVLVAVPPSAAIAAEVRASNPIVAKLIALSRVMGLVFISLPRTSSSDVEPDRMLRCQPMPVAARLLTMQWDREVIWCIKKTFSELVG